jgi:glutamine amidotransferase
MGIRKLRNPNAQSFTHVELQNAMLETIAAINQFSEEAGVNEVCCSRLARFGDSNHTITTQPSLMNFCVTDGVSVVATRYVSSRNDAAASLVRTPFARSTFLRSRRSDVVAL